MPVRKYPIRSEKQRYMDMGFSDYESGRLLEVKDLSPEKIEKLIKQGCTAKLAYRIFRP